MADCCCLLIHIENVVDDHHHHKIEMFVNVYFNNKKSFQLNHLRKDSSRDVKNRTHMILTPIQDISN